MEANGKSRVHLNDLEDMCDAVESERFLVHCRFLIHKKINKIQRESNILVLKYGKKGGKCLGAQEESRNDLISEGGANVPFALQ